MRYILAFVLGASLVNVCRAVPIVFTHEGSAEGTLDGVPFSLRSFVITAQGDTANLVFQGPEIPYINHDTAEINLNGLGTFTFTTGTRTFVNHTTSIVGFSRAGVASDLFNGPTHAVYSTWDMLSSIGPHSGQGSTLQWELTPVVTSGGQLVLNSGSTQATFTARIVPEPGAGTLALLAALVGVARARTRRQSRR